MKYEPRQFQLIQMKIPHGGHIGKHVRPNHPLGKNPGDIVKAYTVRHKSWMSTPGHSYTHKRVWTPEQREAIGDFWSISTKPFKGAHFAVYPEEICIRPIKSSCPKQVCIKCGLPKENHPNWCPSCKCEQPGYMPGVVLDPMCGSGTTLLVAAKLGRQFIGIDINPQYVEMARKRLARE